MESVLALDLATRTGWAHWKTGMDGPMYSNLLMPNGPGVSVGKFLCGLRRWLIPFLKLEEVTHVVYEAAWVNHGRDTDDLAQKLFGLTGEAAAAAYDHGAIEQPVKHDDMATFWCGARHFTALPGKTTRQTGKHYSQLAATVKGWPTDYDDEADALGVLCWFLADRRIQVPWDNRPCPGPQWLDLAAKGKIVG